MAGFQCECACFCVSISFRQRFLVGWGGSLVQTDFLTTLMFTTWDSLLCLLWKLAAVAQWLYSRWGLLQALPSLSASSHATHYSHSCSLSWATRYSCDCLLSVLPTSSHFRRFFLYGVFCDDVIMTVPTSIFSCMPLLLSLVAFMFSCWQFLCFSPFFLCLAINHPHPFLPQASFVLSPLPLKSSHLPLYFSKEYSGLCL